MNIKSKILSILNPVADKESDGRDVWPNRAAFILAAMVSPSSAFSNSSPIPSSTLRPYRPLWMGEKNEPNGQ